jgi:hypothetical protein
VQKSAFKLKGVLPISTSEFKMPYRARLTKFNEGSYKLGNNGKQT